MLGLLYNSVLASKNGRTGDHVGDAHVKLLTHLGLQGLDKSLHLYRSIFLFDMINHRHHRSPTIFGAVAGPTSAILPFSNLMKKSASFTASRRCAMVITVLSLISSRRICCICIAVSLSIDAVAYIPLLALSYRGKKSSMYLIKNDDRTPPQYCTRQPD